MVHHELTTPKCKWSIDPNSNNNEVRLSLRMLVKVATNPSYLCRIFDDHISNTFTFSCKHIHQQVKYGTRTFLQKLQVKLVQPFNPTTISSFLLQISDPNQNISFWIKGQDIHYHIKSKATSKKKRWGTRHLRLKYFTFHTIFFFKK